MLQVEMNEEEEPVPPQVFPEAKPIDGQRSGTTLYMDTATGFTYRKDRQNKRSVALKCSISTCPGRATMFKSSEDGPLLLQQTKAHVHDSDRARIKKAILRNRLYERCRTEKLPLSAIHNEELEK